MPERYFSRDEVEALIPTLTEIMNDVTAAHREAETVRETLREEQQRITMAGGGVLDREAWHASTERLTALGKEVEEGLQRIVELGGVPKDLKLGLVDFPHLRRGQVVNLCWKHGEREIRYWHGLDEGYAGRKPL